MKPNLRGERVNAAVIAGCTSIGAFSATHGAAAVVAVECMLSPEERIIAVEYELLETRKAAVEMILDMVTGEIGTQHGRARLAARFEEAAFGAAPAKARLSRLVAAALRT